MVSNKQVVHDLPQHDAEQNAQHVNGIILAMENCEWWVTECKQCHGYLMVVHVYDIGTWTAGVFVFNSFVGVVDAFGKLLSLRRQGLETGGFVDCMLAGLHQRWYAPEPSLRFKPRHTIRHQPPVPRWTRRCLRTRLAPALRVRAASSFGDASMVERSAVTPMRQSIKRNPAHCPQRVSDGIR